MVEELLRVRNLCQENESKAAVIRVRKAVRHTGEQKRNCSTTVNRESMVLMVP